MLTYVIRRLLFSIVVLFAASVIVFWGMSLVTSPIGFLRMQPSISEQTIHNIEKRKHLDRPIYVRYGYWMKDVVTNKFGTETINDTPIFPDLKRAMGHTLQLVVVAELLAILLAVGIGVYSALRQYSVFDYTATTASFVGLAIPVFWLALMLQVLFVNIYLWFDVRIFYVANLSGVDPGHGLHFALDRAQHLGLPILVLMVASIAQYSRFMRASMLEVVNADYVRTARAKGLDEARVTMKHAFRNALIPMVTHRRAELRRAAGRRRRDGDDLRTRRHGPLLHHQAECRRPLPGDGVLDGHCRLRHHLQSARRPRLRLPRPAGTT